MSITLYHSDCLEVMPTLTDASVDMVLCDLPYGTTACKWDVVIPFAPLWEQYKRVVKPNGAIVLFGSQPFTSALVMSNPTMFRYCWVWRKSRPSDFMGAKKRPLKAHEDIAVFYQAQPTYNPQMWQGEKAHGGGRAPKGNTIYREMARTRLHYDENKYPRTVIDMASEFTLQHPTQKPIALCEYLIRTYTNEGDTVLDNTMGSGTTGVAAANTGRAFVGIELDAGYFGIANDRIEAARVAPRQMELIA